MVMVDVGVESSEARVSRMVGVVNVGTSDADPLSLSSAGWQGGQAEDDLS